MWVKRARYSIFLVLAVIWGLPVSTAWADVFEVQGVPVDITAENAAQARTEALRRGQHEAFRTLLERLVLQKDAEKLPEPSALNITEFVSDFSVSEEKTSPVRYLAKLNVRFKAEPVRLLLGDLGIHFAETRSKPLLIIPIFQEADNIQLWQESNSWRKIFKSKINRNGLVKISIPLGDELDMSTLDLRHVIEGNLELLSKLADRYGAGDTLVSHVRFGLGSTSDGRRLEITNVRYSLLQEPVTDLITLYMKMGESKKSVLIRGADVVIRKLEEEWKIENLISNDGKGIGTFTVPISGLKDWLDIKRRIISVSIVQRLELVLISLDEVRINLHYIGAHEQLRTALRQADLSMARESNEWVLYTIGLAPSDR